MEKLSFSTRLPLSTLLPCLGLLFNAEMCPDQNLFHAVTEAGMCLGKAGGTAYMEEPPSDCTGKSGDTHLLKTRRQIHGISQILLQTLTHHSLTLKAKANQRFHFTLTNMGGKKGGDNMGWKCCTTHQHEATSQLQKVTNQMLLLDFQMHCCR